MTSDARSKDTTILDVKNLRTRDYLRGLLTKVGDGNVSSTFGNLMASITSEDMRAVDNLLRQNTLFKHLPLREEFPLNKPPFFDTNQLLISPKSSLLVDYICLRANDNADLVSSIINLLDALTASIFVSKDQDVLANFIAITEACGHSLALARKLAFVLGHYEKETESWKYAAKSFSDYGVDARNYGMMAIADSISFEFSYLDVKSGFADFLSIDPKASVSRNLSYLSFYPISLKEEDFLEGLGASYYVSLLDAVIYLLAHRELGVLSRPVSLHPLIESSWDSIQAVRYPFDGFLGIDSGYSDLRAFRASPAFLEYKPFRNLRASLQGLYDTPESRTQKRAPSNPFEEEFFRPVTRIGDLLPTDFELTDPLPTVFDRDFSGSLARTCGLVKLVEQGPDFSDISRVEMGQLMGGTSDVDRLLSTPSLRTAAKAAKDSFVELILRTLLQAHSPITKDMYSFKQAFQEYVLKIHDGSIVDFIDDIYKLHPNIVEYFVKLLDETLLSQMPFIVKTAEDVYETRAKILEWFSTKTEEQIWKDRAKQLRIDRKIASVRGQINETRLNIDGLRFRQWIESSKLTDFSAFIRQVAFVTPVVEDFRSRQALSGLRLTAHREPTSRALVAVMECYKEFCTNPDFGVASYLGRRIRHGTLRGTLLDDLPDPSDFGLSASVKAQHMRWLESFRASINTITSKLHFTGKGASNQALISPDIDSKEKWNVLTVCLSNIHSKSQVDHGASAIPLIIEQYCWYIFELELHDVQKSIANAKDEFGIYKLKSNGPEASSYGFEKAMDIAISQRFSTVASWFKKPPNISPVAEITDIIEVVLREARAEYHTYAPSIDFEGTDMEISGGVYYHVYDALSIIIRNAAKHGRHPGALKVSAVSEERASGSVLKLDVSSRLKPDDTVSFAMERMETAGSAGPANADIVEGLSGVRKLHKMQVDQALLKFEIGVDPNESSHVAVTAWFALTGIV